MNMAQNWTITKDKFLTQVEIQKLYSTLRDAKDLALQRDAFLHNVRDYFLIRTMFETGLRVFEVAALRVSDFRNGSIIVRSGKNGKPRNILLTKGTQKMLFEFLKVKSKVLSQSTSDDEPLFLSERKRALSTRGIRKRTKHWFNIVGIDKNLSCHASRHSYISHALAAGAELVTVRDNAGHSSLAITSIYAHTIRDDMGELELFESKSSTFRGKKNF